MLAPKKIMKSEKRLYFMSQGLYLGAHLRLEAF